LSELYITGVQENKNINSQIVLRFHFTTTDKQKIQSAPWLMFMETESELARYIGRSVILQ